MRSLRQFQTFYLFNFFTKRFHKYKKKHKAAYSKQKFKKCVLKNIYEEKSYLFAYLRFVLLLGCAFMLLVLLMLLVRAKSKEFKRSQETSFCVIKTIQFLTALTKLVFVRMYVSTVTGLVGPLSLRKFSFLIGCNKLVFVRIVLLLVQWDKCWSH